MAVGGFLFFPLSHAIGRSSAIFWSLVWTLVSQIWAALMIHRDNYNAFIVSRVFGAFFGVITALLGPGILLDLFYLHQRGRAFTVFHCCFNFGTVAGPTLSAFVSASGSWTGAYWWTAGLVGGTLVPVFWFLEDTTWDRGIGALNINAPGGFLANRLATFCPGSKVTPKTSFVGTVSLTLSMLIIETDNVTVESSCNAILDHGLSRDSDTEYIHPRPLRILRCHEFALASMVTKTYRSRGIWIFCRAERNLSASCSPTISSFG
jgi:MFS family permease